MNHYSPVVHRNGELLIEMKVLGPKKVTVKCQYCGDKQTIEVDD
jgi:hypothetical protein